MAARSGSKNGIYFCIELTGGGAQALDALDITATSNPNTYDLINNDIAIVTVSGRFYVYSFNASSTEAESSPDYIRPDDFSTTGVWELIGGGRPAVLVNNSNGNPNISDTYFDVDAVVPQSTWESFGPTGSGADNEWAALDNLPTDINWIKLRVWLTGTSSSDSSGQIREVNFYIRKNGSAESIGPENKVAVAADVIDSSGNGRGESIDNGVEVAVSSRMFDIAWNTNFNNGQLVDIHLTGYGY